MTTEPSVWLPAVVSSKVKLSLLTSSKEDDTPTLYPVIPLNPRTHPVKKYLSCVKVNSPITGLTDVTDSCGWVAVIILSTSILLTPMLVTLVPSGTKIVSSAFWTEVNFTISFTAILVVVIPMIVVENLISRVPLVVTTSVLV